ncbi:MAG: GntR family transcriptional regulator, partial [Cytophagales bacterium]|nr:GntR family transcriptional regulator [Armatimonadota bacterium]
MGRGADDLDCRLREHLRGRGIRIGEQLPGERELAAALGVGRTALRPSLDALEAEGVVERRPQSGTFLLALPAAPVRGDDCGIALIAPFQATSEPGSREDAEWLYRVVSAFERVAVPAGARLLLKDQSPFLHDPCSIKDLAREAAAQGARAAILLHPAGPWEKITCALALLHDAGVHPVIVSGRDYPG